VKFYSCRRYILVKNIFFAFAARSGVTVDASVTVTDSGDGLTDEEEDALGSGTCDADSDDDEIPDGGETTRLYETDPGEAVDTESDNTIDALDTDSDGDGTNDTTEATGGHDTTVLPITAIRRMITTRMGILTLPTFLLSTRRINQPPCARGVSK